MASRSRTRKTGRGDRLRVAVLMGGPSSEHEVSLAGGQRIVLALDPARFEVQPVVIARDGDWFVPPRVQVARGLPDFDPHRLDGWKRLPGTLPGILALAEWPVDVVFPCLHGRFGEDGAVQACLAAAGIAFVGSASGPSAIAMDKVRTKEILAYHGFATPPFEELAVASLRRGLADRAEELAAEHGTPLVLKDPLGGSSLEVRIADDAREIAVAIEELVPPATRLMVEAYVPGRELTAAVIYDRERGEPVALPIVEIRPRTARCFDYHEKYASDGAEELCPAPIPEAVEAEARRIGLEIHEILGLRGLSRTDLILDAQGLLHVLEVNTLPGMTEQSLVPRAAREIGMSFPALVENLLRTA